MNIQKINLYNPNYSFRQAQKHNIKQEIQYSTNSLDALNYAYRPIFKGKSIPKLYEEYNWYINNDRVPALKSFLKIEETPEVMDKFLTEILKTKDRSKEFFDSFIYNPREVDNNLKALREKVGGNSINLMPFMMNSPYNEAYTNYIEDKLKNERCLISLLKIRPDWRGDTLIEKYKSLHGTDKLEIGNIPKEFPNGHLAKISDYLRQEMQEGFKSKKSIQSLTLDNRKYDFAYFTEGKSDKNVFGVFTPEGKKFVLKMGKPEMRSLDAPFALGTLAKIDSYLTTHRCRNSAPLCYYNHDNNYSVYKYIEHIPINEEPSNLSIITKHLNDFRNLGMSYNDTAGYKNFFMLAPNSTEGISNTEGFADGLSKQEWITVDNDHVTYSNRLQPMVSKYHTSLPNAMQMFF